MRGQAWQVKDAKVALQHNLGLGGAAVMTIWSQIGHGLNNPADESGNRRRFGRMTHDLDAMAIRIEHEGRVVARMIVKAQSRSAIIFSVGS
jgi:hypothetical protein